VITEIELEHFKAFEHIRMTGLGRINVLVGRNNAGKSSILHVLDLAGIAIQQRNWQVFPLKLDIRDLFWEQGDFSVSIKTASDKTIAVTSQDRQNPTVQPNGAGRDEIQTILLLPDPGSSLTNRRVVSPREAMSYLENRDFINGNALDFLGAIRHYAERGERGFTMDDYESLIAQVKQFFPELENIESDLTDQLQVTLRYRERGRNLDILYSGTGLKRILDVLIKVTLSKASVILLDEPEFGMHPDLQRRFLTFLSDFAEKRDLQVFIATHSPIFINSAEEIEIFRVENKAGKRSITHVSDDQRHILYGDLGLRPSDLLQNDICVIVEGADDVTFFEYVIHELYQKEFSGVTVGVTQYGGSAGSGPITSGSIAAANVSGGNPYTLWVRDRDAKQDDPPSLETTNFARSLRAAGQTVHVLRKREIEFYVPESVYVNAPGNGAAKQQAIHSVLQDQSQKFKKAMGAAQCQNPGTIQLERLLKAYLKRSNLASEIKRIITQCLLPWAREIKGN